MTLYNVEETIQNSCLAAYATGVDSGGAAGTVEFYTAGKTTLLVTVQLNFPAFNVAAPGLIGLNTAPSVPSGIAVASGNAAIAVFKNSGGTEQFYGTVTATGGGGDVEMSRIGIVSTETVPLDGVLNF